MAQKDSDNLAEKSNMIEQWQPVQGFEGLYEVSNHGRVKSCHKCNPQNGYCWPEIVMSLCVSPNRYQVVWLRSKKRRIKYFVHRLVAMHFLTPIEGKEYVNHKDKDRLHNHVRNLEYMTHQENCDHRDGKTPINNDEPF